MRKQGPIQFSYYNVIVTCTYYYYQLYNQPNPSTELLIIKNVSSVPMLKFRQSIGRIAMQIHTR